MVGNCRKFLVKNHEISWLLDSFRLENFWLKWLKYRYQLNYSRLPFISFKAFISKLNFPIPRVPWWILATIPLTKLGFEISNQWEVSIIVTDMGDNFYLSYPYSVHVLLFIPFSPEICYFWPKTWIFLKSKSKFISNRIYFRSI